MYDKWKEKLRLKHNTHSSTLLSMLLLIEEHHLVDKTMNNSSGLRFFPTAFIRRSVSDFVSLHYLHFCFFLTWSNQMEINGNAAVKTSPSQSPLTSTVVIGAPTWASCDRNPSVMWSHSFSSMNTNVSRSSVKDGGLFCWNSLRSRFFLRDNFYFNFKFRQKQPNLTSPVVTLGDDTTYKQTT